MEVPGAADAQVVVVVVVRIVPVDVPAVVVEVADGDAVAIGAAFDCLFLSTTPKGIPHGRISPPVDYKK